MSYIKFNPIYQQRIWGGKKLQTYFNRTLPGNALVGESWEIVDRKNTQSKVIEGKYLGLSIRDLIKNYSTIIMGPDWSPYKRFPLIVKWLDCQKRLSLQVHPPKKIADHFNSESKDEAWFIASSEPNSNILVGFKKIINSCKFKELLLQNNIESLINKISVSTGDFIYIPSGRIHAIDGGNLILEIQENSNTTYRVYDWGRIGLNGKFRSLHVDKSIQCINFKDLKPTIKKKTLGNQLIAQCSKFRIRKIILDSKKNDILFLKKLEQPKIIGIISGQIINIHDGLILKKGDNVLLPYSEEFIFKPIVKSVLLLTDQFLRK